MPDKPLLIVGAGGHAMVVIDAIRLMTPDANIAVFDDDERKHGLVLAGCVVTAPLSAFASSPCDYHVAVGNNAARERIDATLSRLGFSRRAVVHPRACVSASAVLGDAVFVAAQAVVAPTARLGTAVIVNHGAVVDHECIVGAFSHIAPNATLAGNVRIGQRVLIGAGANILPGITIGDDCMVGAGAVVINDLAPGTTHVGVPARRRNFEGKYK